MPQNLSPHQPAGGSQALLGRGMTISIRNTEGEMQKLETSKIATFPIAFGMGRLALVKGLFEDQVTVI